jgi:hypothetical protein
MNPHRIHKGFTIQVHDLCVVQCQGGNVDARPWRVLFIALLLVGAAAAVGYYAYQAGIARGVAEGVGISAPSAGTMPVTPYGYGPYFHPRPFGFGPLGCLVPFLFFFVFFGLLKGLFWGRRWGWGPRHGMWGHNFGPEGSDAPPMFREWHRRAHEDPPSGEPKPESK